MRRAHGAVGSMSIGTTMTLDELEADPDPILARLRAEEPVCWVPGMDMWLVTRWDDVTYVCTHPDEFTGDTDPSFLNRNLGKNMLGSEGRDHERVRTAMEAPFQPGMAGDYARQFLVGAYGALLDDIVDSGEMELMSEFAEPVGVLGLQLILGLDNISTARLGEWCRGLCTGLANFESDPELEAVGARARDGLGVAIDEKLDHLERRPDHSALSHMLQIEVEGERLSRDEIVNNVRLMISGGINEPRDGVGLVLCALFDHPEQLAAVREDPSLVRRAVEETFRYYSPVGTATRQVTSDLTFGGSEMRAGDLVSAVLRSANRDERHWTEPDRFDLHRTGQNLAFSTGPHHCLGSWLGRQEVRVATQLLLDRLPGLRLAAGADVTIHGFEFRGPQSIPLEWDVPPRQ